MFSVKSSTVKLNNGSIDYVVFGKGSRDMVIIPGLSFRDVKGAGLGLAYTFRIFADDFRVYVLDKNSVIEDGCTVSDIAEHTAEASTEIADRLGCERYIYDSLGHSAYDEAKDFNKRIFDFLER